jgi:uncharacterized oxidoreductase
MQLTGRTALITGGAGGIGVPLARALIAEGTTVIACGRSAERLAAAQQQLPQLITTQCDITDEADVAALRSFLGDHVAGLDILINNAALNHPVDWFAPDAARLIRAETDVNLNGTVLVTTALLPMLTACTQACLAFVTSGIAYAPAPDVPGYSMTKAALHSLARSLRYTLRNTSVSVVEIVPPAVDTDMIKALECRKMAPEAVAQRVVAGLKRDRKAIRMGQTHVTYRLNRLWPTGAERLIRGSFD